MGAINQSEFEFEQRSRTYAEILSRAAAVLARHCAICAMPITLTKERVVYQCDKCGFKLVFQQQMEDVRQSLELNND